MAKSAQPLYPEQQEVKTIAEISNVLSDEIRRFKNPYHKPSRCDGSLETVLYLFDRTDAFIYAARTWGGRECCLQAMLAGNNLGLLRDIKFVLPGLLSHDYNERLITIACLAFLQDKEAIDHLYNLSLKDIDGGVRESALWAFAFLGGNIKQLIAKVKSTETSVQVLDFTKRLENCDPVELWFI